MSAAENSFTSQGSRGHAMAPTDDPPLPYDEVPLHSWVQHATWGPSIAFHSDVAWLYKPHQDTPRYVFICYLPSSQCSYVHTVRSVIMCVCTYVTVQGYRRQYWNMCTKLTPLTATNTWHSHLMRLKSKRRPIHTNNVAQLNATQRIRNEFTRMT